MSARILRWGLLGTGRINEALMAPLRMSPRNRLTAVASRDGERAAAYARRWNIPRSFARYEAMLADPDIDVIYNSLPNSLHSDWTVAAAQAGKHVLCEKPLAITLPQVDAIVDAAQAAGVVVAEAFMYRHHPQTLKVKEIVDSGVLGQVYLVRGGFTFTVERPGDIRLDPAMGGGSIWDVGCYPVSYARYLVGAEPEEVFGWQITGQTGIDESFVGQLRFPGGALTQFDCGLRGPLRMSLEIVGANGALTVFSPYKPSLNEEVALRRDEESWETISVPGEELYLGEVEDMADAVLEGKPPRISLASSRSNVATLLALLESARTGKPVTL